MSFDKKMNAAGAFSGGKGRADVPNPANKQRVATVMAAGLQDARCAPTAVRDADLDTVTDLKHVANDGGEGGRTAYTFTRKLANSGDRAARPRYGKVQGNITSSDIDLPHGGIGQSGIGPDRSTLALYDGRAIKRITRALAA